LLHGPSWTTGEGEEGKVRREGKRIKGEGTPRRRWPLGAMLCEMLRPRRKAWTGLIVALQLLVSSAASSSPYAHRCAISDAACAMCHPSVDRQSHIGAVLASGGDVMAGSAVRLRGGGEEKAPAPAGPRVDTRFVFRAQSCNAEDANVVAGTVQSMHVCMMYARYRPMYACRLLFNLHRLHCSPDTWQFTHRVPMHHVCRN
jgi:hypothetical protein